MIPGFDEPMVGYGGSVYLMTPGVSRRASPQIQIYELFHLVRVAINSLLRKAPRPLRSWPQ